MSEIPLDSRLAKESGCRPRLLCLNADRLLRFLLTCDGVRRPSITLTSPKDAKEEEANNAESFMSRTIMRMTMRGRMME